MSITAVPISMRLVRAPIAASNGKGDAELPSEVMDADERAVDTELLGGDRELDRLDEGIRAVRVASRGRLPVPEREETEALHPYIVGAGPGRVLGCFQIHLIFGRDRGVVLAAAAISDVLVDALRTSWPTSAWPGSSC